LAETGHLVISTLHTSSAVQTINRLLSFFPLNSQNAIREKLADTLK
jgi:twitching motility protein PilT